MKSTLIGSLKFQFPPLKLCEIPQKIHFQSSIITCSLRGGRRKPLWRAKRLSTEAIQAIQSLKLAKSSNLRLEEVFKDKVSRLLKADLLDTLEVLQNQNELDLAIKMLGKNKLIEIAEEFFSKLEKEGLKPDTRAFTEMIGAYLQVDMIEKAMETYNRMKASGCDPDKLTFAILIRNLDEAGREELAATIKKECSEYMDYPDKFLEELEQKKHARRKSLNLV